MGIEYSAKLLVGLPADEMTDLFGEDVADECYAKGLEYASPYYDAPPEHWVIGVKVARTEDYDWCNVDPELIEFAHARFLEITNKNGELILSPHAY